MFWGNFIRASLCIIMETVTMSLNRTESLPFRPRARMLVLLGDQLIKGPGVAAFELIKNAYDAGATSAKVVMRNLHEADKAEIEVVDNGSGMDWDTLTGVWLEPGTDFRKKQRETTLKRRHEQSGRLPIGEKGIGRFAAHKLGNQIALVTRASEQPEIVVSVSWKDFETEGYIDEVPVKITRREPQIFKKRETGTRITISDLRDKWTKGMVRDFHRSVMAISSPFSGPEDFQTEFILDPDPGFLESRQVSWLDGLLDISKVLDLAIFKAECRLSGRSLEYDYRFEPTPGLRLEGREVKNVKLSLKKDMERYGIGPVKINLYIYDRDPTVLSLSTSDKKGLREFLNENGGIRVYRNGVRVYDYGERGNDWLDLGGRRVNVPTKRISNNLVIGAVSLDLSKSSENVAFAIAQIETERNKDKDRIRAATARGKVKQPVIEDLSLLRQEIEKRGIAEDLSPYIDRIERQFEEVRDQLLVAASSGLSFSIVIHEIEKGIAELVTAVERDPSIERIKRLAKHLSELIDNLTYLTRKSGKAKEKASSLIRSAVFNINFRLEAHRIQLINGIERGDQDFEARCSRRLITGTIMNLIDNSIWWLENKGGKNKKIYVGTSFDLTLGPAIIVADNGPGFIDDPGYLIQPFVSRKPDGMGLGLHIASEIMQANNGHLIFPEKGDIELPEGIDGAIVALVFGAKS
jgi:signal transduction histidine kinase